MKTSEIAAWTGVGIAALTLFILRGQSEREEKKEQQTSRGEPEKLDRRELSISIP